MEVRIQQNPLKYSNVIWFLREKLIYSSNSGQNLFIFSVYVYNYNCLIIIVVFLLIEKKEKKKSMLLGKLYADDETFSSSFLHNKIPFKWLKLY